jgi:hypothetical protein
VVAFLDLKLTAAELLCLSILISSYRNQILSREFLKKHLKVEYECIWRKERVDIISYGKREGLEVILICTINI